MPVVVVVMGQADPGWLGRESWLMNVTTVWRARTATPPPFQALMTSHSHYPGPRARGILGTKHETTGLDLFWERFPNRSILPTKS